VTATDDEEIGLESAIANVYGGPLEDFVGRRAALAKELRSAGRREDATAVKGLRKPSRMAWALDVAAVDDDEAMDAVVAAVAATLEAQATGGDVRGAIAALRAAVREFAGRAARAAEQAGHRLAQGDLATALLAVLARSDAFAALRRGSLAEIPEAGGLDFLGSLPAPPEPVNRPAQAKPRPPAAEAKPRDPADGDSASPERAERAAAARAAARQANDALAAARDRADEAQRALREIESQVTAAEERLRRAEEDVRATRNEADRVRRKADAADAALREAENALEEAERRVGGALRDRGQVSG
jgi:hypothetical protein